MILWLWQLVSNNQPQSILSNSLSFVGCYVYGDNVFEKCGINRDGAGEVGKPRYFNGKRHF